MMPKSVKRFSDHIMLKNKERMMPKSVKQVSDSIMRKQRELNDA